MANRRNNSYYHSVVRDAIAGDSDSFAILYASTYQDIYQRCSASIDNIYDIQDVMHDTYVVAYKRLPQLSNADNFDKWLAIICDSQLKTFFKKKGLPESAIKRKINSTKSKSSEAMSLDNASQLLESIFLAVNAEPNGVDLETLLSYHQYKSSSLILHRLLPVLIIIALILIPLLFISPTVTVTKNEEKSSIAEVYYDITVKSLLPVQTVIATQGDANLIVTQEGAETYAVSSKANGPLSVVATIANGKAEEVITEVTEIDAEKPDVLEYHLENGQVVITVVDEGYGVDFGSIIETRVSDGQIFTPTYYSESSGVVILPYLGEDAVLYVSDKVGNSTSFAMSPTR